MMLYELTRGKKEARLGLIKCGLGKQAMRGCCERNRLTELDECP